MSGGQSIAGDGRIRVLIVDDIEWVRNALQIALSVYSDIEVVGTVATGQEAINLCGTTQPDVIVMDLLMPAMDGVMATRLVRQQCPRVQVIAISISDDPALKQQVLRAGAYCWLSKSAAIDNLVDCIRAAKGASPLAP